MTRPGMQTGWQTFAWPLAITVAVIAALILGLLGTGWADVLAAVLLAAPTLLCVVVLFGGGVRPK